MLQIGNIVKKPIIWLPAIITSAILGPVSTLVFKMTNNATGSGMGTAGLVGQINTYQDMVAAGVDPTVVLIKIIVLHIVLPAILAFVISEIMRKKHWIEDGRDICQQLPDGTYRIFGMTRTNFSNVVAYIYKDDLIEEYKADI